MKTLGLIIVSYVLAGLLITMLMDRFVKLELWVLIIGVLVWPLALPIAIISGFRDLRQRKQR